MQVHGYAKKLPVVLAMKIRDIYTAYIQVQSIHFVEHRQKSGCSDLSTTPSCLQYLVEFTCQHASTIVSTAVWYVMLANYRYKEG